MDRPVVVSIEDDPTFAKVYSGMIAEMGAEALITDNAEQGLLWISTRHPKLVLLDVMLGGGRNGFDILEEMRRLGYLEQTKVVMLTNLDSEEQVARTIGVSDYIVKVKVSLTELKERLGKYL